MKVKEEGSEMHEGETAHTHTHTHTHPHLRTGPIQINIIKGLRLCMGRGQIGKIGGSPRRPPCLGHADFVCVWGETRQHFCPLGVDVFFVDAEVGVDVYTDHVAGLREAVEGRVGV